MEKEQEREWAEAQNIRISVDLVEAAKNQLKLLAAVDRNRYLYDGPALNKAIYRYNAYWLPLLAKHLENPVSDGPLVVPLDCEWIWHCHRLNPVRYKSDCETLFGRVLGNHNVISSVQGTSKTKTEETWNQLYPEEPYELDSSKPFLGDVSQKNSLSEKFTSYDLVSAVKRQVSFFYQVSRAHMSNEQFLQEALARYKGFLHLVMKNKKGMKRFSVPTYDIDLIWHSHQLHPIAYCNDLCELLGKVLEHDDTDSDRSKGQKLDTGFSETTKQYEEVFGLRYWKAGAMYRGITPNPVAHIPCPFSCEGKYFHSPDNYDNLIQFQELNSVEVLLEFVEIKTLPESHKGNLYVSFRKKQPDKLFNAKRTLSVLSESTEKQVAYLQCEPRGEFLFELGCQLSSNKPLPESFIPLGSCSLSLQDCLVSGSQFFVDKWIPVNPAPNIISTEPMLLRVSLSFTSPTPAVQDFHLVRSHPFYKGTCFFPLLKIGKAKHGYNWTRVIDDDCNDALRLKMRDFSNDMKRTNPDVLKEVQCVRDSGETHTLAELQGDEWLVKGTHGSFKLSRTYGVDGHLFNLVGYKMVKLFTGRRLDYETKDCENKKTNQDYITAVEFSTDYPYGKAVALIDFKHGTFKVKDGWMILTGIIVAFIVSDIMKRESGLADNVGFAENKLNQVCNSPKIQEAKVAMTNGYIGNVKQGIPYSGGCGGGCSGGCDGGKCVSMEAKCGGGSCGGGNCGGGKCGSMEMKSARCGGGGSCGGGNCGSGKCGSMATKSARCSGGCGSCACDGGECGGSMATKSAGCGGGCDGGKCRGSMATKCGGGSCGGGKCSSMAVNSDECGGGFNGGKCESMVTKPDGARCGGGKRFSMPA